MAVKSFRPLTPSLRYMTVSSFEEITKKKPEKSLVKIKKKTGGPKQLRTRDSARYRWWAQAKDPDGGLQT
jgi:large subunit ribosomal protein L2